MPRKLRRLSDDHPSPFDPNWKDYFKERRDYLNALFQQQEERPPSWIVENLLPRGYLALLAGRPKDGKTCLAASLATAVARGEPFAGMNTARNNVLYFAAEESAHEWEIAIRPWLTRVDPKRLAIAHARFAIDHDPDLFALRMKVEFDSIGLIVVDPLLAATTHSDFATAGRARNALMGLKTLCMEKNVAAIVVHHAKERKGQAQKVAENPQLAATASLNVVLNHEPHPQGRLVTLSMTGRGLFANRTLRLLSQNPGHYERENVNHPNLKPGI